MSFGIPVRNGLSVSLVSSTFLSSGRRLNPALNLDFLTGTLDPRITFSRGSQATLVDSTGKLTCAPNNLLTNSEDFEAAAWLKLSGGTGSAPVITSNAGVAPNGTTTADRLVLNRGSGTTSNDLSRIFQGAVITSGVGVFSVWLRSFDGVSSFAITLTNGSVSSNITVTGSWQRFSLVSSNTTANAQVRLQGDVGPQTADLLVWGAQLEQVTYQTTPGTYNSTTPKNLLGYTQEFDNAAWTKSNAFVQTNLLTYSEAFDNVAWSKQAGATATANTAMSPIGTMTADTVSITTAVNSAIFQTVSTIAGTCTMSIYARVASGTAQFQMASFSATDGVSFSSPFTVTTSWQRFTWTRTVTVASNWYPIINQGALAAADLIVWGAQLVQGSTAGDYQRTDAAAAAVQYVAPDGSLTADKVVPASSGAARGVYTTFLATGAPNTASVYLKAGEKSIAGFVDYPGIVGAAWFNLATGEVSNVIAGYTASITSVGGGWYRCSITASPASGTRYVQIFVSDTVNSLNVTANGTDGIYIWGAQLSNSASIDPYVYNPVAAPTSAAYYGPRFDYDPVTLANKGLLIEDQRTNLVTYSQDFDNGVWPKTGTTVTANAIISPDGTVNADKVAESASTSDHYIRQLPITVSSGATVTLSLYAKAAERSFIVLFEGYSGVGRYFNLANGTVGNTLGGAPTSSSIVPVGNGWYRCSITATAPATTTDFEIYISATGTATNYAGTAGSGIYIYGAQLEAGSFATSYIPTVASQVTRTADVALMQGANFSNWYNQEAGTVSLEGDTIGYTLNQMAVSITDGTITNPIQIYNNSGLQLEANVWSNGTVLSAFTYNSLFKYALGVATNNVGASLNGGSVVSDLSVGPSVAYNRLNIGNRNGSLFWNGHIRRIGYYNTRLPNTALVSLTAPNIIPSLSLDFTTQVFNVG